MGAQIEYKDLYLNYLKEEKKTVGFLENINLDTTPLNFRNLKTSDTAAEILTTNSFYENMNLDSTYTTTSNLIEQTPTQEYFQVIKGVLNKHNFDLLQNTNELKKPILFVGLFNNLDEFAKKNDDSAPLWGFKQKKYKRLQKFAFLPKLQYNPQTFEPIISKHTSPFILKSTLVEKLGTSINNTAFDYQQAIASSRQRAELVPINLARRLLRTKRTLVLPAHVNLTIITNSYDVVHSWFIPGLGLKLDCVPGRSTHHSFYIDNVGFYYGQCAEICGRYHHHMPIRLCALPFEQFLV